MQSESKQGLRDLVRIARAGAEAFHWGIWREGHSVAMLRSTQPFATRIEALLDAARAAATLGIDLHELHPPKTKASTGRSERFR